MVVEKQGEQRELAARIVAEITRLAAPLGRPVDPEVNITYARLSAHTVRCGLLSSLHAQASA